jgi:hypothetical protein
MLRSRSKGKRIALAATVAVLVLCVGLFVKAYRSAAPGTDGPPVAGGAQDTQSVIGPAPSASPTPTAGANAARQKPGTVRAPGQRRTISLAGPAGFTFKPPPAHHVVLTVTSSQAIGRLGYLVPTSPDHSSGDIRNVGTHWSLTTRAYGKPDYAAIFIAASAGGAPTTCTISIDGVVKSRQTTHGIYGRALCVA